MDEAIAHAQGAPQAESASTDVGSDAFYRAMTELSPQIAWMATAQGDITFANEHWFRYTGLPRDQTFGDGWVVSIEPSQRERITAAWQSFIESGESWSIEVPYLRASDSTYRWHLCRGVPIRSATGVVTGWLGFSVDIHDEIRAAREREALVRSLLDDVDRMAVVFKSAPAFMGVLVGPEHRFEMANDAFLELIGHESVVGRTVVELMPEMIEQGFVGLLDEVSRTGRPFVSPSVSVTFMPRDGRPPYQRTIDLVYQPLLREDGSVCGILAQGTDVTNRDQAEHELRRLAAELAETDRHKTAFIATLSHELRNPLAPLRTGLELLDMVSSDSASAKRTRRMMGRQLDHLTHLVNDLLDVARISSGKLDIDIVPVDLKRVVGDAVETSMPAIDSAGHRLSVVLPPEPLSLPADPTRIAQVLGNLLHNAAKYTPAGGSIELRARRLADRIEIEVEDDGIGIDADAIPRLFIMFSQIDRCGDLAQGGLGIGLSLARTIAELHGGTLSARSGGTGQGSTFVLALPFASPHALPHDASPIHRSTP